MFAYSTVSLQIRMKFTTAVITITLLTLKKQLRLLQGNTFIMTEQNWWRVEHNGDEKRVQVSSDVAGTRWQEVVSIL